MSNSKNAVTRPTAASIVRFLEINGKRHLFLTGERGSGKSTLHTALRKILEPRMPFVCTWAKKKEAVWLEDKEAGVTVQIGAYDLSAGRMHALIPGFEKEGQQCLLRLANAAGEWAAVDEIGFLESPERTPEYWQALEALLAAKRVLAVIRKQDLPSLNGLLGRTDACVIDLDAPFLPLGCIIMASGLGNRFGGNKLLARLDGQTVLERLLESTDGIFQKRIVVTRNEETSALCRQSRVPVVLHGEPHRSDTVRLGMQAIMAGDEEQADAFALREKKAQTEYRAGERLAGCIFCQGDQPLVSRNSLQTMAFCAGLWPEHILRLSYGEKQGAPVIFPRRMFSELCKLPQGKGGSYLLRKYEKEVREIPAQGEEELWDIDTQEDLLAIQEWIKKAT